MVIFWLIIAWWLIMAGLWVLLGLSCMHFWLDPDEEDEEGDKW